MIRGQLIAKQTQVFDKKADQIRCQGVRKNSRQRCRSRSVCRRGLSIRAAQRSPCDIAPRQSAADGEHCLIDLIRFFRAFLALFSTHIRQA
jgi:hypothetical protein